MKSAKLNEWVWVIAYIDSSYIGRVNDDLSKYPEYKDVTAYIPTVKLLKKSFKGKNTFEEVPLLFNYGFFKMPRKYAIHKNYLENLKRDVACIFSWVNDPSKVFSVKPKIRPDGKSIYTDNNNIPVATATAEEVSRVLKETFNYSAHDQTDIDKLKPGDRIVLHGYPWENIEAEVVEINQKKQELKVKIRIFDVMKDVKVSFDNVFFSVYHNKNYDDSVILAQSMDMTTSLDKKTHKKFKDEGN